MYLGTIIDPPGSRFVSLVIQVWYPSLRCPILSINLFWVTTRYFRLAAILLMLRSIFSVAITALAVHMLEKYPYPYPSSPYSLLDY